MTGGEGTDLQMPADAGRKEARRKKRSVKPPSIQTVLDLSTKPVITECKVCDILYNPLNEKDIKFHTKWHAVACKKAAEG